MCAELELQSYQVPTWNPANTEVLHLALALRNLYECIYEAYPSREWDRVGSDDGTDVQDKTERDLLMNFLAVGGQGYHSTFSQFCCFRRMPDVKTMTVYTLGEKRESDHDSIHNTYLVFSRTLNA